MRLFYRMNFFSFFTIFFNKVKFFERDVNIYGKQITLFEKKKIL